MADPARRAASVVRGCSLTTKGANGADPHSYLEYLEEQVDALARLADRAESGSDPDIGASVRARTEGAELRRQVERVREWLARQPQERSRGKSKQGTALVLIAAGRSTIEVARELGVDARTIRRWRADPEFDEQLRELQEAQTDALHALLTAHQLDVGRRLVSVVLGIDTTDQAVIQGARVFFELLGRWRGSPVAPVKREGEIETEEQLEDALDQLPDELLRRVLEKRAAAKAEKAASRKKRAPVKDL